jgi:hypothetical protein
MFLAGIFLGLAIVAYRTYPWRNQTRAEIAETADETFERILNDPRVNPREVGERKLYGGAAI